jgi:predicted metal-dependent hydrolase
MVIEKLEYYNTFYNFKYNRISIKNQKTKWGSCSSLGNLNFNYRLLYLPQRIFDYIVVHELCHLGQMNHSADFWKLVEKTFPDYDLLRSELKKINMEKLVK